ncbi:hypothetical protein VTO42DRAFT_2881 [Malbranchea cinnamomea]
MGSIREEMPESGEAIPSSLPWETDGPFADDAYFIDPFPDQELDNVTQGLDSGPIDLRASKPGFDDEIFSQTTRPCGIGTENSSYGYLEDDPIGSNVYQGSFGGHEFHRSGIFSAPSALSLDATAFRDDPAQELSSSSHRPRLSIRSGKNKRLPKEVVTILRSWLHQHRDNPYPTSEEKEELARQTGLDRRQITHWFSNARRRKIIGNVLPAPAGTDVDSSLLSPLERWRQSPPESEAAAPCDILRALADAPCLSDRESAQFAPPDTTDAWSSNSSNSFFVLGAPSMSSLESSGSEVSCNVSNQPFKRPPTPLPTARRRHRRQKSLRERKSQTTRTYQCTFCSDSFRSKYDWQRHEKALHLPVDRWHCAPQGGIAEIDGHSVCVFCRAPDADDNHLESHNYLTCREKHPDLRTFSRKDHLRQHLRLTHKVDYHPSMDGWRESIARLISRCGFCDAGLTTWEERVEHLAEHFKNGADMDQWNGGWGFEPDVERLVENALPPYLLGQERRSMDPWKTSNALGPVEDKEHFSNPGAPNVLDRFVNLRRELLAYLREQIAAGNAPSDQMIQEQARLIAYEDDDPWNNTWADDPMWLMALRHEAGLATSAGPEHSIHSDARTRPES